MSHEINTVGIIGYSWVITNILNTYCKENNTCKGTDMVVCLRNFKNFYKTKPLCSFGQDLKVEPGEKGHGGRCMLCKMDSILS